MVNIAHIDSQINKKIIDYLKIMMELNYNVKSGKEIKMDGNKVGTATAMADYYIQ